MSEKVEIKRSYVLGLGAGVLLWFLLRQRPDETDIKIKEEHRPVDITGDNNEVTKGVKIEDVSLIKINPNVKVEKYFQNKEYFGNTTEVPEEHYKNWLNMAKVLNKLREMFGGALIIKNGYSVFRDGERVDFYPKNGKISNLWTSITEMANGSNFKNEVFNSFSSVGKNLIRYDLGVIKNIKF